LDLGEAPGGATRRRAMTSPTASFVGSTGEGARTFSAESSFVGQPLPEEKRIEDEAADEEEDDEACVFAIDGGEGALGALDDEDEAFAYEMVVFEERGEDDEALPRAPTSRAAAMASYAPDGAVRLRSQPFASPSPPLGASPVLLSALQQVAAEMGTAPWQFKPGTL